MIELQLLYPGRPLSTGTATLCGGVWVKSGCVGLAGVRGLEFWTTNWNPLPNPNDRIVLTGA